jgi:hypothetical protein
VAGFAFVPAGVLFSDPVYERVVGEIINTN